MRYFITTCFLALFGATYFCYCGESQEALSVKIEAAREAGSLEKLQKLRPEVEATLSNNTEAFYTLENRWGNAIAMIAETDEAARLEMESVGRTYLNRDWPAGDRIRNALFSADTEWMARFDLATNIPTTLDTAKAMANVLGRAQGAIIANYVMKWPIHHDIPWPPPPVPATNPPQYIVILTDLNQVKDPIARNAWKAAVAQYNHDQEAFVESNYLQRALPQYVQNMKSSFYHYCNRLFLERPDAKAYRDELGRAAQLSRAETGQLGMAF